jgi:hypothetical protein
LVKNRKPFLPSSFEIHRHVGVLGQRLHVDTVVRIHRDADRRRGVAFMTAQLQRLAQHRQQIAGDVLDVRPLRSLLENDDEFVAAEPG